MFAAPPGDQPEVSRPRRGDGPTYMETDLDSGQSKDLSQVTALLASFPGGRAVGSGSAPGVIGSPPPSSEAGMSAFRTVVSAAQICQQKCWSPTSVIASLFLEHNQVIIYSLDQYL